MQSLGEKIKLTKKLFIVKNHSKSNAENGTEYVTPDVLQGRIISFSIMLSLSEDIYSRETLKFFLQLKIYSKIWNIII